MVDEGLDFRLSPDPNYGLAEVKLPPFEAGQFYIDTHEPIDLVSMLMQGTHTEYAELNRALYSDYLYLQHDGKIKQWERKTWSDLGSNLNHIEDQLSRQMRHKPEIEHGLIIEGV